jgi:3-(methylthio)propanoyl-CoA dehydrogenase
VAELVTDMRIHLEAARTLTYATSRVCDLEFNNLRVMEMAEHGTPLDAAEAKRRKELARTLKRLNGMLTPMAKYYASEMCMAVASEAIQVLGGSGYMKDYPVERYLRDSRITTIYEGTSQLQVVAAVRGVCSGAFEKYAEQFENATYQDATLAALAKQLAEARQLLAKAIAFTKQKGGNYMDLAGRKLVDSAITVIIGHLFLGQAVKNDHKRAIAIRFIETRLPNLRRDVAMVESGDTKAMDQYETLAGPVPAA